MPQISIIVPVYKVEPYLRRCVDSILNQTFTDFELILVDDGSPDNCPAICDEYAETDSRIHVIHQKNGGLSAARNAGIDWAFANSDSEYLTFIDSDDWVHYRYCELLYQAINLYNTDISICGFQRVNNFQDAVAQQPLENTIQVFNNIEALFNLFGNKKLTYVIACAKLYKKVLFKDIRYPVGMLHEDEFVTYKLLYKAKSVAELNLPMYYYFLSENSITRKYTPKRLDAMIGLRERCKFFKKIGSDELYYLSNKSLMLNLASHYRRCLDELGDKKLAASLKKEFDHLYHMYKTKCNISIKTTPEIYNYMYPKRMNIYWTIMSIIKKLKFFRR